MNNELVSQTKNIQDQIYHLQHLTSEQNVLPRIRTEIDAAQQTNQF